MRVYCLCDELETAAYFYAEKLKIEQDVRVFITMQENLGYAGYCEPISENFYKIVLNSTLVEGDDPLDMVLAHEMVHVRQYASGDLKDEESFCVWKGERFYEFDVFSEEYFFSPWEVEAYGVQVGLYHLYCRSQS